MTKKIRHIFHIYHPVIAAVYIFSALVFTMLTHHPVYIAISLLCGSCYAVYLIGYHSFKKTLFFASVLFIITSVINPLFSHGGITVLFYIYAKPVTAEAAAFGIASGGMLASVLIWFRCYSALVTNEKFLYLFGRPLPTLALMLSMITRLIPLTGYRLRSIQNAQKAMRSLEDTKSQRIKQSIRVSSILMSWSMEDCIETSDSMKARGYGCKKRTSFSVFRWNRHDYFSFVIIILLIAGTAYLMLTNTFTYFPAFSGSLFSPYSFYGYILFFILLMYPLLLESREVVRWKL